jgi:hypothetical protein
MSSLAPFACFHCHQVFRRPGKSPGFIRLCPHCGHTAYQMGRNFHPPKPSDQALWDVMIYLAKHGFYYQPVHNQHGAIWEAVSYPHTLDDAQHFVKHFCDQAIHL